MTYDLEILSKKGRDYIQEISLFILQKHELIDEFFAGGKFQEDVFRSWAGENNVKV